MAASGTENRGANMAEVLKPFYQRASEAEARLSRLEVAHAGSKDAGNEELLKMITELQSKLEGANAELASEREKANKLAMENAKLQYRVIHLVREVRKNNKKSESITGGTEASAQTMTKITVSAIAN